MSEETSAAQGPGADLHPATLIANPVAGGGRRGRGLVDLLDSLRAAGWAAELRTTRAAGDATRLARDAADSGRGPVFAHGGDGTVREVARGLLGTAVPLGVLPGGTTNVFARALGLPRRAEAAASRLAHADVVSIDVGRAGDEPFLMMVSGGIDGAIMAAQSSRWKRRLGRGAFAGAGLAAWWRYRFPVARIHCDDEAPREATFVAVCNIPLYAGSFTLAPGAELHDRHLDLVVHRGARAATLGMFRDLLLGARHIHRPDVERRRLREVEISAPESFRFQIDGDPLPVPDGRLRVTLASERLRVLFPAATARSE